MNTGIMGIADRSIRKVLSVSAHVERQYYSRVALPKLIRESRSRWVSASPDCSLELRKATLSYIQLNQKPEHGVGAYSYKLAGPPLLYASCYAALTRHLYGDLDSLPTSDRAEWVSYIQGYQCDDGLFRDSLIDIPMADELHGWGWRHLTLHVLMALSALGGVARKPFRLLDQFRKPGRITEWLNHRAWKNDPASVSNEVHNCATLLQYARDFHHERWCEDTLNELYGWLDQRQDPKTGLWGNDFSTPWLFAYGVQTGYHLWLLYFYDMRPIQYVERIIDSCLATQNRLGGFGVFLNSSACEDIDSIDPLVRFYQHTEYRKEDIRKAFEKALPWVLANANPDGGWVFRRGESFHYGHDLMSTRREESAMFPTWFRTLSLAYLGQVLSEVPLVAYDWRFLRFPGHQFWCSGAMYPKGGGREHA